MTEQVRFEVGEKYENMKGIFEVVAIRNDSMDIRWESGEEITTPIALQQRIIERMAHEKELEKEAVGKKTKKAKARAGKSAKPFDGLEDGDFGLSVTKTVWRGRGQLGGAVARQMKSTTFKFNSWAVLSQPEVHWLDVKRQKQETLPGQLKFYVLMGHASLGFGLLSPRLASSTPDGGDWQTLIAWLGQGANDDWLKALCVAQDLYLYDTGGEAFSGTIEARESGWVLRQPNGEESDIGELAAYLRTIETKDQLDLRIEKRMKKSVAIEKGDLVAEDIADLFMTLMPIYDAVAAPAT